MLTKRPNQNSCLLKKEKRFFSLLGWRFLLMLTRAELKSMEYNSVLGALWSLLHPLILVGTMYLVFHNKYGQAIPAYSLYLLSGIITVNLFVSATTDLGNFFYSNRDFILNSTVPKETIFVSELLVHMIKFSLELLLCIALSLWLGFATWNLLLLIPFLMLFVLFVSAVGILIALATCFIRDIQHIWLIASRFFLICTPIFYQTHDLGPLRKILITYVNPLTPFVRT
jgi:ABC-type polysaccharide/polyol phosphate export permease